LSLLPFASYKQQPIDGTAFFFSPFILPLPRGDGIAFRKAMSNEQNHDCCPILSVFQSDVTLPPWSEIGDHTLHAPYLRLGANMAVLWHL